MEILTLFRERERERERSSKRTRAFVMRFYGAVVKVYRSFLFDIKKVKQKTFLYIVNDGG